MTVPTEVAAVLAEMRSKVESIHSTARLGYQTGPYAYAGEDMGQYLRDAVDDCEEIVRSIEKLESALTKAEAVEPVAEVYEWHTCGRDALGEAYRQSKGVAMRFIGPALPIGTKLYAHAVPVESQQADAKDAARFRHLRDHAINTEGAKGTVWCVYGLDLGDCTPTFGAELVAFVDDAMANGIVCSPVPVESLCGDCPPAGYPTEATRCEPCPRRREPAASVPDGWVLVPIQYTKFMMDAAIRPGSQDQTGRREAAIWNAMIAAAPQPPTNQEGAAP